MQSCLSERIAPDDEGSHDGSCHKTNKRHVLHVKILYMHVNGGEESDRDGGEDAARDQDKRCQDGQIAIVADVTDPSPGIFRSTR